MTLKPAEFHPRPKIDSVVVDIDFSKIPQEFADLPIFDRRFFTRVVRVAFSQRRKTLLNTLSSGGFFMKITDNDKALNKKHTREAIESAEINPLARAESLDIPDFVHLTKAFMSLHQNFSRGGYHP